MIYKPAYDVNFIIVNFLENWNIKERHINFRSIPGKKGFLPSKQVKRFRREWTNENDFVCWFNNSFIKWTIQHSYSSLIQ